MIDPIDGTRAFISGIPVWGTLAGLTIDGDAVAGLMAQPFTNELFMCDGEASWYEGPGGTRRLETRKTTELSEATLFTTTPALFKDEKRAAYDRVEQSVRLARYGTDCYAYSMLAAGFVDLVVETGLHPYDIVALIPIIEKAGGVITTWDGGPAEKAGSIVAAATPELHAKTLDCSTADVLFRLAAGAWNEGVESGEELLAIEILLLKDFMFGTIDGQQCGVAQLQGIALDRRSGDDAVGCPRRSSASGSGSFR